MPPSLISAWRRASSSLMPARRFSSMCIWRWLSSSDENSASRWSLRKSPLSRNSHACSCLITSSGTCDLNSNSYGKKFMDSLVAQRDHRVDAHGAARGNPARQQRHTGEQQGASDKSYRIGGVHLEQQ